MVAEVAHGLVNGPEPPVLANVIADHFGYRVNYRRVLETQTRLLGRVVTAEAPRYVGFETR